MTTLEKARKYLARHAGQAVSHRQLAKALGVCHRQARRVTLALRSAGALLLAHRGGPGEGANAYAVSAKDIPGDPGRDVSGGMLAGFVGDKTGDISESPRVQREEKRREEKRKPSVAQKITDDDGLRAAIARKREELRRISGEETETKPAAETAPGSIAAAPANAASHPTPAARAVAPQANASGSGGKRERTPDERAALRAVGLRALGLPATAVQDARGVAHAVAARMGCDEHFTPYLATLAGKTFSNVLGLLEAFGEWLGIAKWIRNAGGWLRQKLRKLGVIQRTMFDVRRDLLRRGPR